MSRNVKNWIGLGILYLNSAALVVLGGLYLRDTCKSADYALDIAKHIEWLKSDPRMAMTPGQISLLAQYGIKPVKEELIQIATKVKQDQEIKVVADGILGGLSVLSGFEFGSMAVLISARLRRKKLMVFGNQNQIGFV